MITDEQVLVLRREHHHGGMLVGVSERREDLPADTKIRVSHVRAFHRTRVAEGQLAELGGLHSRGLLRSTLRSRYCGTRSGQLRLLTERHRRAALGAAVVARALAHVVLAGKLRMFART